jgi:hypothetical protein
MFRPHIAKNKNAMKTWLLAGCLCIAAPVAAEVPYSVAPGVFDLAKPGDLGLKPVPGAETITIFKPDETTDRFSNGAVLIPFKGRLYAQWQSSKTDEDSPDTWVAWSVSDDGRAWSAPRALVPSGSGPKMHSSGGWWTDGETLVAFINVWPTGFQSGEGGYTEYMLSRDGVSWSKRKRVKGADGLPVEGIVEQDPHAIGGGRIVTAFHIRPGMIVAPFYTDDPLAVSGWRRGKMENLPHNGKVSRELEPSLFLRGECAVMVFRDQAESFKQLASESCDRGQTWTTPVLTNMADARAKQSAGNLPDGVAYLVNAPGSDKVRIPLAVTLSNDGRIFDRSYRLRGNDDLQPSRYPGQYKRPGYSYPKSVVWNDWLYVAYATNKEDVELTRVPLRELAK